jgi:hypothetical protein
MSIDDQRQYGAAFRALDELDGWFTPSARAQVFDQQMTRRESGSTASYGEDIVCSVEVARDGYSPAFVERRDALADAARDAEWDRVFQLLSHDRNWVNAPRLCSRSGYAPLHQAAWHGASTPVVERLLALGAWRTLRTANSARPLDIALAGGHHHLVDLLTAEPNGVPESVTTDIQTYLHALIVVRSRHYGLERVTRLPQVEPLLELSPGRGLWCPVPGMYGGFALRWDDGGVVADSWCRVVEGSEQRHRVGPDGVELVNR